MADMLQKDDDVDTPCPYGHKRCFRVDYAILGGVEHETWRRGPTCWVGDCPAHTAYLQNEQPGSRR
jgi:hypothetical protein